MAAWAIVVPHSTRDDGDGGGDLAQEDDLIAGRYRLASRAGSGAMGVVWRAHDERLDRIVAVKQVLVDPRADDAARDLANQRVMREARITARLHHPGAIAVYDVVEHEGYPCLIMEYLPSRSLAAVLAQRSTLPVEEVAAIGRQVADALAAAHSAGIVHRDVKPANVLITDAGRTKITDFGISRAAGDVTLTTTGMMAGTPAYLAPEIARGAAADFASDVYSLGSTLYAALEGVPPFGQFDNALALLHRVSSGEIVPPTRSGALTPLVQRLLQPDPSRRPAIGEIREELGRLAEGPPVGAAEARTDPGSAGVTTPTPTPTPAPAAPTPPPTPPGPATTRTEAVPTAPVRTDPARADPARADPAPAAATGRRPRRRRSLVAAAAALVAVAVVVVVALLVGGGGDPSAPDEAAVPTGDATTSTTESSTSSPAETSTGTTPDPSVAQQQQSAVTSYYGLIPGNLADGWSRLTPSYQQNTAGGFSGYENFWGGVRGVNVSDVRAAGNDTVRGTVAYTEPGGRVIRERTEFRMVMRDGIWKINGTSVTG